MKGIFLKEIYTLRSLWKSWLVVMGILAFNGIVTENAGLMYSAVTMIGLMCTMTSFGYDSSSRWETLALSLPVTREQMVRCRYWVGAASMGSVAAVLLPVSLLMIIFSEKVNPVELLASFYGCLVAGLLMLAVLIPTIYRFGVEKARYLYLALIGGVGVLIYGLIRMYAWMDEASAALSGARQALDWLAERNAAFWAAASGLAALAGLYVSYLISVRIYAEKEF